MAIQANKLFTLFMRYDDAAVSGKELAKFINSVKTEMASTTDLVAGTTTRIGVEGDGAGRAADGTIGTIFIFPSALTDAQIASLETEMTSTGELIDQEKQWWRMPAMGGAMAI